MAGSIEYAFDPNQVVHVIVDLKDPDTYGSKMLPIVRKGRIVQIKGSVLVTRTELEYHIQLDGQSGLTPVTEDSVFATLADAVVEYERRLA